MVVSGNYRGSKYNQIAKTPFLVLILCEQSTDPIIDNE